MTRHRRPNCRRPPEIAAIERAESRAMLSVTAFAVSENETSDARVLSWLDGNEANDHYELWVDQLTGRGRNVKIAYVDAIPRTESQMSYQLNQPFDPGVYQFWIRGHGSNGSSPWVSTQVTIDNDNDPVSPLQIVAPKTPTISFQRRGQGAAGQSVSEGAIGWNGNTALYDVWLGKRDSSGALQRHLRIRNVSQSVVALRQLATAWEAGEDVRFADLPPNKNAQLPSGNYELYVRGVNGAVDDAGNWIGRGSWSQRHKFEFHRVEEADARPQTLSQSIDNPLRIEWSPVPNAEGYLVNVWAGPDYSEHRPISVRLSDRSIDLGDNHFLRQIGLAETDWKEVYVRVRGIGEEGMLQGLRPTNFASIVVKAPQNQPRRLEIRGPSGLTSNRPTLTWNPVSHNETYEVWLSSVDLQRRVLLANQQSQPHLVLSSNFLSEHLAAEDLSFDSSGAAYLPDGQYRFWVRPTNGVGITGQWSTSRDFFVESSLTSTITSEQADLVAPNRILSLDSLDGPELLVANGQGESFGASSLVRYRIGEDGLPFREASSSGNGVLFSALEVGSNVTDLAYWGSTHALILSRGSGDIHAVDLRSWEVVSNHSFVADINSPEPISMAVLPNDEILVVFHRTNQLHRLTFDGAEFITAPVVGNSSVIAVLDSSMAQISATEIDGRYRLFMSSGKNAGTVVMDYDPIDGTVENVGRTVSRNANANPHVAATVVDLEIDGNVVPFFIAADRNGFITWINGRSLEHGFEDLAPHLDCVSRDPTSPHFTDPNDNRVDSSQILAVGQNKITVINNREQSVVLQIDAPGGKLEFTQEQLLPPGFGVAAWTDSGQNRVAVTSPASNAIFLSNLSTNTLLQNHQSFLTSDSFVTASTVRDDVVLLESSSGQRSLVVYSEAGLSQTLLPETYSVGGRQLRTVSGLTAAYFDPDSQQTFALMTAVEIEQDGDLCHTTLYLLVLNLSSPAANPSVESLIDLADISNPKSIQVNSDRITISDRLGGAIHWFDNWRVPDETSKGSHSFTNLPAGFGKTRSGRTRQMPDGTIVTLHDTSPDRVFSVVTADELQTEQPFVTVHAHNQGQWINDMEVLGADRIVAVTWDARLLILNIRTGVLEHIRSLQELAGGFDLHGIPEISFHNNRLIVMSPGGKSVASFSVEPTSTGYLTQLMEVQSAANPVSVLQDDNADWFVESHQIQRVQHKQRTSH